jgi:Glyoxalase/Bleomycin resistance protein/Dioxygenase superfamily
MPSRDVEADLAFYRDVLGARVVFAIEAMGTRVAEVALAPEGPRLVIAGHLAGDAPVLLHRVDDLEATLAELSGLEIEARVGLPLGPCATLRREASGSACTSSRGRKSTPISRGASTSAEGVPQRGGSRPGGLRGNPRTRGAGADQAGIAQPLARAWRIRHRRPGRVCPHSRHLGRARRRVPPRPHRDLRAADRRRLQRVCRRAAPAGRMRVGGPGGPSPLIAVAGAWRPCRWRVRRRAGSGRTTDAWVSRCAPTSRPRSTVSTAPRARTA